MLRRLLEAHYFQNREKTTTSTSEPDEGFESASLLFHFVLALVPTASEPNFATPGKASSADDQDPDYLRESHDFTSSPLRERSRASASWEGIRSGNGCRA